MRLILTVAFGVSSVFGAAGLLHAEPSMEATALAMKSSLQSQLPRAVLMAPIPDQSAETAPLKSIVPGVVLMAPIPDTGASSEVSGVQAPVEVLKNAKSCLAKAVYFEARGESTKGQEAVAEVVMTRTHVRGKSVCGVVYEGASRNTGCQFSFTCDGISDVVRDRAAWARASRVAGLVLSGRAKDVTHGATNYHANYVTPYWASSMTKVKKIGSHVFYR
jgi:spore germination cell wall hydrolase CwlJ-like protein